MVLTHVKEEEEVLFPFLRARLTDEVKRTERANYTSVCLNLLQELRYMGYMIALVKATAPPHPKQRPGPLLAPLAAVKYFTPCLVIITSSVTFCDLVDTSST